jgi:hypothetical protein
MIAFLQCRKSVLGCMLFCAIVALSGCKQAPLKPTSIGPNDTCYYCRSPFNLEFDKSLEVYAAEMIAKDGFVRKYDDMSCLIANAKKVGLKNIKAIYAVDFPSRTWLPAEQLHFVRSDQILTPKNGGFVAFRDIEQAKNLASRYKGSMVQLNDLIK